MSDTILVVNSRQPHRPRRQRPATTIMVMLGLITRQRQLHRRLTTVGRSPHRPPLPLPLRHHRSHTRLILTIHKFYQQQPIRQPLIPAYSKDIIMVTNTDVIPHEPITLADVVR